MSNRLRPNDLLKDGIRRDVGIITKDSESLILKLLLKTLSSFVLLDLSFRLSTHYIFIIFIKQTLIIFNHFDYNEHPRSQPEGRVTYELIVIDSEVITATASFNYTFKLALRDDIFLPHYQSINYPSFKTID